MEMQMEFIRQLPKPAELKEQFPLDEQLKAIKQKRDDELAAIFRGEDKRFILVIGPCSADREDAVLDYMGRLKKLSDEVGDKLYIVPRCYTNKPRTKGVGYKGMLHQPDPTKEEDMLAGIIAIRKLHTDILRSTGFTCAEEMLYPENHRYLSDLLGYVAVGARSVENQQHRIVSSGVGIPVGMKNPTSGDLGVMMNAIYAAQNRQRFVYRGWEVQTTGNQYAHAILRGSVDKYGRTTPNYYYEDLQRVNELYENMHLRNAAVIVDTNHSNSGKHFEEQIRISKDIMHSRRHSDDINRLVKGLMIESYLVDGAQTIDEGVYGKSITDPCLGWEKTEALVRELAEEA
ncbi:MAG: 3-deoxy-7-phosphoheptulonate synthase [Lachnospiraceae bacterium]|nr:3-deoxy-7-phosphoheptulonate synthase [Lachnospiraceae bacterium]